MSNLDEISPLRAFRHFGRDDIIGDNFRHSEIILNDKVFSKVGQDNILSLPSFLLEYR